MSAYGELDAAHIVATTDALVHRISERFPDSGLARLSRELLELSKDAASVSAELGRANWWWRAAVGAVVAVLLGGLGLAMSGSRLDARVGTVFDLAQGIEATVNDVVFVGVAIFFLMSLEVRPKRSRALRALHRLRQIAHIIDMHQLTKDPERVVHGSDTPHSPKRVMTPFELTRYLDYCTEMLAILGKLASLYVQRFDDPVTSQAAADVENLTVSLSRNIWQKIMILDRILSAEAPRSTV